MSRYSWVGKLHPTVPGREASEKLLEKYSIRDTSPSRQSKPPPADHQQTILVTGTTGRLGSYLLDGLESCDNVAKVVCLNRAADGGQHKQAQVSSAQGLNTMFSKSEFIHANLAQPYLGLGEPKYDYLLDNVDRIIHNAWSLNLHLSVESFELQIQGVRRLVDFASRASKKVPIIFVSSISTASLWRGPGPTPEAHLKDLALAVNGYSQSKLVGNLILHQASEQLGVPTSIIRVGQIAGTLHPQGVWNKQEWLPMTIASSVFLGLLPKSVGPLDLIDWTPIEIVAVAILDIAGVTTPVHTESACSYYNILNPSTSHWDTMTIAIQDFYAKQGRQLKIVSLVEWIEKLSKSATDFDKNPAVQMLSEYKALQRAKSIRYKHPGFEVGKARKASTAFRDAGVITPEMMATWCEQWRF